MRMRLHYPEAHLAGVAKCLRAQPATEWHKTTLCLPLPDRFYVMAQLGHPMSRRCRMQMG